MRVLLPLKKKQDDPNSQDQQNVDDQQQSLSYSEGGETTSATTTTTHVEACAATVDAADREQQLTASPSSVVAAESSAEGRQVVGGGEWTTTEAIGSGAAAAALGETTSPTAVLLSAAAARLSCLAPQLPESPTSSSASVGSAEDSTSPFIRGGGVGEPVAFVAAVTAADRKAKEELKPEAGLGSENTNSPLNKDAETTAQQTEEHPKLQAGEPAKAAEEKPQEEVRGVLKKSTEGNSSSNEILVQDLISVPLRADLQTTASGNLSAVAPARAEELIVTTTSAKEKVATTSTLIATPAISTRAARKRRSSSPPTEAADLLDLKQPASKKLRDSKPPALERTNNNTKVAAELSPTTTLVNNNNNMAGGRKIWTGAGAAAAASSSSSSYYVETAANGGGGGREDVSNSRDDGAEVDVRFTYRHENDPSSARGDHHHHHHHVAAASSSSNSCTTASTTRNNNSNNNNENSSYYYDVCGRDDEDVQRERESGGDDRPEGGGAADDDNLFALKLKKQGLEIVEQEGDGNCLFRAISLQVYGDASMHGEVRQRCLDFMARDKEHFSQFITDEPFGQYIRRKRQDGVHGNNPEIQAISELFNRPIEVFVPENGASPLNIFHAEYKTQDAPIRLSYHDGNHYNAVIDPLVPTAGLGLGLPGLQPGLADKLQMAKAVAESDRLADQREYERALEESQNDQLQRAIKESTLSVDHLYQKKVLSLSDCDATNFELEQAVLESSLESFRTFEHGRKQASKATSTNGRRKRQASPPLKSNVAAGAFASSSVASIPREARQDAGTIPSAASAALASPSVASAPAVASRPSNDDYRASQSAAAAGPVMAEHYPQTVQELVMNGFELRKVVHAYELIGDNFDDLMCFLLSNTGS